jgi:hypothetical protein
VCGVLYEKMQLIYIDKVGTVKKCVAVVVSLKENEKED